MPALIVGCLVYLLLLNLLDWRKNTAGSGDGRTVAAFLAEIEQCEAAGGCDEPVALERDQDEMNSFQIDRLRSDR
jgi:hypothetical protein